MNGERFYTFRGSAGGLAKLTEGGVRFFAIDSNYLDKSQLDWLRQGARGLGLGLEDLLLPPSALLLREDARLGRWRRAPCWSRSS